MQFIFSSFILLFFPVALVLKALLLILGHGNESVMEMKEKGSRGGGVFVIVYYNFCASYLISEHVPPLLPFPSSQFHPSFLLAESAVAPM